ncbi:hypothetical protein GCM10017781_02660 [Deinococcus metalli]|uniref:Uncharacterized protein n=1 Tax=Deinococcus metalli TaxID=1141878 RepID=A0ABQ3JLW3_9DEIO|nr:hypothetical protein GCM10017781_02660 [Deinococcus metalli]
MIANAATLMMTPDEVFLGGRNAKLAPQPSLCKQRYESAARREPKTEASALPLTESRRARSARAVTATTPEARTRPLADEAPVTAK